MPWSAGVYTRDNGTFTGSTVWAQDRDAGTNITASNHDTHDEDLATAINNCLAKDGQNAMTGDLNMGTFDITNAADGSFTGSVGVGIATPATTLHVESGAFTIVRIRNNTANASSGLDVRHSGDTQCILSGTNGATNGSLNFDINAAANGTGTSLTRFNRSTNITGTVAAHFFRGNNSTTYDHALTSGTSGDLAEFARNGGAVVVGNAATVADAELGLINSVQRWDLQNGSVSGRLNFVDVTGGSVAPFQIEPGATSTLLQVGVIASGRVDVNGDLDVTGNFDLSTTTADSNLGFVNDTQNWDITNSVTTGRLQIKDITGGTTPVVIEPAADTNLLQVGVFSSGRVDVNGILDVSGVLTLANFTDGTRPAASSVPSGSMIYNTSDNAPNFSDGTNWRDAAGSVT